MSDFERGEGSLDNLGENPEFVPLDELAIDTNLTPDEILMEQQDEKEKQKQETGVCDDFIKTTKIIDLDEDPSNWEADVEIGKYDEQTQRYSGSESEGIGTAVSLKERQNIVQIEEMKGWEQKSKYWDAAERKTDNSKKDRLDGDKDSIRFDKAM